MAACLIAVGSNLGDRSDHLRRALRGLGRLLQTQLLKRSAWYETPPVGGPTGQGSFLNGAVLAATSLTPEALLAALHQVEADLGRVRAEPWGPRTIDLDLLLYDSEVRATGELTLPHPLLAFRGFVLEPAAEIAAWMTDPDSGWTVAALLDALHRGANHIAIAAEDELLVESLIDRLSSSTGPGATSPRVIRWRARNRDAPATDPRPTHFLAVRGSGSDRRRWRKMLHLPESGPVAWLAADLEEATRQAQAAIQCMGPEGDN